MSAGETRLITRFFDRGPRRDDVAVGIGDDAAALRLPPGEELVATVDTLVAGTHFPDGFAPGDIGYRALAVNLSDIAAMGAVPVWALLSLALPAVDDDWLEAFAAGFFALADRHAVALAGGDLVRGPLSVTVTLLGRVPAGSAVTRAGARPGDQVFVTGAPGTAARGLASLLATGARDPAAEQVFRRPVPRLAAGRSLRGLASAMIDVSDGLVADAGHIAAASGVQLSFDLEALRELAGGHLDATLAGGDDYELCFCCPADRLARLGAVSASWDCDVTRIGTVTAGSGVRVPGHAPGALQGYDHFAPPG